MSALLAQPKPQIGSGKSDPADADLERNLNTGWYQHPVTKNLVKRNSEIYYMQKEAFKIMGALLVLVLAVSFSVGAVSAIPSELTYSGTVDITDSMLALTHDVPSWPSTDPIGDFMPAASALGVLREASLKDSTFTYDATYTTGTGAISIAKIGSTGAAGSGEVWYPYIYDGTTYTYAPTTTTLAGNNMIVHYLLAPANLADTSYFSVFFAATKMAYIAVTIKEPTYEVTGTVSVPAGSTALDVLNATKAAGLIHNFNYTWVEDYYTPGVYYAWLVDINGVPSYDWDTTGYGYALLKDNVATASLDQTFFNETSSIYKIFMGASTYGGNYGGTSTGGYYDTGITESLTLTVTTTTA